MKKVIFSFLISLIHLYSQDNTLKVLFDLTSDKIEQIEQKLLSGVVKHKNYYESQFKELEVAVIIHGGAYKFFLQDLTSSPYKNDELLKKKYANLKTRIVSLHNNYDVKFYMCDSGRKSKHISINNIPAYITLVPSAAITLIEKQNAGYAYMPIH